MFYGTLIPSSNLIVKLARFVKRAFFCLKFKACRYEILMAGEGYLV